MLARWQFKRGFRAGLADAKAKRSREVVPGSWFGQGHKLGVSAYATCLDPEEALAASLRGVFEREKNAQ